MQMPAYRRHAATEEEEEEFIASGNWMESQAQLAVAWRRRRPTLDVRRRASCQARAS
jgi:hypothetical protein